MPIRVGGVIAAVMLALGALLPWATVSSIFGSTSVAGTDGDGVITLVCAIVIGVMFGLWKRPALIVAAVLAGISLLVGIIDFVDIGRTAGGLGGLVDASPGIGLILTVLAAITALALAVVGSAVAGRTSAASRPQAYGPGSYGSSPSGGATLYPQAGPATAYPQAGPATAYPTATAYPQAGPAYPQAPPAPPVAPAPQTAPAGWQPDPYHQAQWRYWDGSRWTEHVQ